MIPQPVKGQLRNAGLDSFQGSDVSTCGCSPHPETSRVALETTRGRRARAPPWSAGRQIEGLVTCCLSLASLSRSSSKCKGSTTAARQRAWSGSVWSYPKPQNLAKAAAQQQNATLVGTIFLASNRAGATHCPPLQGNLVHKKHPPPRTLQ